MYAIAHKESILFCFQDDNTHGRERREAVRLSSPRVQETVQERERYQVSFQERSQNGRKVRLQVQT